MRKFIKSLKNSIIGKLLKAIWRIIWWAIEAVIIFIAIIIVVQRVTNNEKSFLGIRIFNVATGSMEPEYAVGDILIAMEKDPSTIKVDDNIVYLGSVGDYKGKIITHNVIKVEQNEDGEYLFHTKGIANTLEDPVVHENQLYGIVVQNNIVLAWICKILTNKYGLYFFVIIPIILYAFIEFVRIQGEKVEQEKEEERERRRLAEEKRKKKKVRKVEIEVEEDIQEDEEQEEIEIQEEEVIKTPKKSKSTTKKKAEVEETQENSTKAKSKKTATTKKPQTAKSETTTKTAAAKKQSAKKETAQNIEKEEVGTKKKAKSTKKSGETAPKTTKTKKTKEE